jgi:hypothetical protein
MLLAGTGAQTPEKGLEQSSNPIVDDGADAA